LQKQIKDQEPKEKVQVSPSKPSTNEKELQNLRDKLQQLNDEIQRLRQEIEALK
jgi:uncharacterized coiled-coil DUF342 family protein